MKPFLFVIALFAALNLHADPKRTVFPKNALDSLATDPFTFVNTAQGGFGPNFAAYSHNGKFLATSNISSAESLFSSSVTIFSVDCKTGALTTLQDEPLASRGSSLSFSPCDTHAVVGTFDGDSIIGSVELFEIDCDTGMWSPIQTINDPTQIFNPFSVSYSPRGRFVAAANFGDQTTSVGGSISMYRVSPTTGKLIFTSNTPNGNGPRSLAFSPDGRFLAVTLRVTNQVSIYSVEPVTGSLTLVQTIPSSSSGVILPQFITYQHDGRFAAISHLDLGTNGTVQVFSVDKTTGFFTPTQEITSTGDGLDGLPSQIAFSQDDTLAVVGSLNATAAIFQVCDGVWTTPAVQTITFTDRSPIGVALSSCDDFAAIALAGDLQSPDFVNAYQVQIPPCS